MSADAALPSPPTAAVAPRTRGALLSLTFLESCGTVLLERALYFFTHNVLGFDETQNLWLALAFGITYVVGALGSHRASRRLGERRLLVLSLVSLLVVHTWLTARPDAAVVTAAFPIIGFLRGIKWPVVESYVSAGRTPAELVRDLARFNTTWALSVPLAMACAGRLIALGPGVLFASAAALNVVSVLLALLLPQKPVHLEEAHPERPSPGDVARLAPLLASARWCMLSSYALLFLLAPLMPELFTRLGLALEQATAAAGLLDLARVVCFAWLGAWVGWRGRALPLVLTVLAIPLGFFLISFGRHLALVIAGELVFGLAAGFTYTAALYYALVLRNASVDAGGAHEGLIGLGFALGPLAGLCARTIGQISGSSTAATLVSIAPLLLATTALGLRPLRAAVRGLDR